MPYMPERPTMPCRPCEPPPPCPAPDPYAPVCHPPKPKHPCGHNPEFGPFPPIPPVPSPIEGSSLYETMGQLTERVNMCIEHVNVLSRNGFEALNKAVAVARANDVYYSDKEVSYTEGFDQIEGCTYALVEKKVVDCKGQPIYMQLVPAYRNSSNPGATQPIFDASFIESANVIMTAVQAGADSWGGPAMWNGNPIPGTLPVPDDTDDGSSPDEGPKPGVDADPEATTYVYGFTRKGGLRFFPSTISQTTLVQQGMFNVIGNCIPILYDGKPLAGVETMTERKAVTAIGYNSGTGSVFMFACSAQNQPGMGIASVARVLQEYGCTAAVVTSATANAVDVTNTEGMLYMGQMTVDPNQAREPKNLAFWVISKKGCFRNDFQQTIADLVQTTGQNNWKNYLLGVQIQEFDDRILANSDAIKKETERAMQAETWLQENINKEVNRAMQAEAWLQENINAEVDRANAAEKVLDDKIDAETDRATRAERQLQANIDAETVRATQRENQIASDLNDEILRATNREREIQAALDAEIAKRIAADNDIINSIEQEILARRAADTELRTLIEQQIAGVNGDIGQLQQTINGLLNGATALPYLPLTGGQLTGRLSFSANNTAVLGRGPTGDMEAATKKYVDDAVAAGGGGGGGGDVSKDYVDQQVTTLQQQITGKVAKAGDTMTGTLNMGGNKIENPILAATSKVPIQNGSGANGMLTGLAAPTDNTDATNKVYVDTAIAQAKTEIEGGLAGAYLPTAGGDMTGSISMTGASAVEFYDTKTPLTPAKLRAGRAIAVNVKAGDIKNEDENMVVEATEGQVINRAPMGVKVDGPSLDVGEGTQTTGAVNAGRVGLYLPEQSTPSGLILPGENGNISITPTDANGTLLVNKDGEGGLAQGVVGASTLNLYTASGSVGSTLTQHDGHLDLNVHNSQGTVYVNRAGTTGGTGELYVTEIHAPNELRLTPGTSVNAGNTRITNVSEPVDDMDAVNKGYLNKIIGGGTETQDGIVITPVNDTTKVTLLVEKSTSVLGWKVVNNTLIMWVKSFSARGNFSSISVPKGYGITCPGSNYTTAGNSPMSAINALGQAQRWCMTDIEQTDTHISISMRWEISGSANFVGPYMVAYPLSNILVYKFETPPTQDDT